MHLNDEKPMIYWIILVTLVFFLILLFIPVMWESTLVGKY